MGLRKTKGAVSLSDWKGRIRMRWRYLNKRKRAKIKLGLQGSSGSGKTYSSLLMAYGLTSNWETIAVVDTENHSAELYSHLGPFKVLPLSNPYTPEKYIEAIDACTISLPVLQIFGKIE